MSARIRSGQPAALVTGIGVAAPNGLGARAWWAAVLRGESGIGPVTRFDADGYPVQVAGEIDGFVDEDHVPARLRPATDRITRLTLAVAAEALADADAAPALSAGNNAGAVTASSAGGVELGQSELQALWSKGRRHVSVYHASAWFPAAGGGQLAIRHQLQGPGGAVVAEQAGGLDAVAQARRELRNGARLMLAGGVDSALCPWAWAAHMAAGTLSTVAEPALAYRPFAPEACGHVLGEGGALLVIEDAETAQARGATGYGTVAGCAATFDGPGVPRLRAAAERALADAGVSPADVDVVFADAAGERGADRAEAEAITALFGPYGVPVTAPKTMTGRLLAGGSSLDLAAALLALRDGVVPPTTATERTADDCPLDLVIGEPRRGGVLRCALVLARGRGGFNSAAVVRGPG
ncbi:act minimal PKS chain-length factor (CLF/KS beta) [Streptomyces sp. SLBN-118]|uniref:beta-ketoacyl synthase N-terminal-like domain-containing protein n=1 Tax=Streptomyces sp. SLBN-118 TaxID=2768454 RepID=UPI001154518F|nr:beta-ketoacyl synthase N-terminal-like domain-containing protein [Streptomyces sp. SLBN-118]TQK50352.1 act minimal PKS chain-length factor (CLF/KS beta) [Streptomyces sp. SLBN-118]